MKPINLKKGDLIRLKSSKRTYLLLNSPCKGNENEKWWMVAENEKWWMVADTFILELNQIISETGIGLNYENIEDYWEILSL